jgi:hypothetical protein
MADHGIGPHHPPGVSRVQEDRAVKAARPILHARIIMRMRDRDGAQTAQCADQRFGRIVQ